MAYLNTRRLGSPEEMDVFLKGGISGALKLQPLHYGFDGLTLVFTTPSKTVTFADASGGGLSPKEVLRQMGIALNSQAVTTEGSSALSGITMASETLTLFLDGSATETEVVFATESGEAPILAVLNAALNPVGVTATAGGGTPGGLVLTSDDGGADKSIQITATGGGQAKLTATVETQSGSDDYLMRFMGSDIRRFDIMEIAPSSGVVLDGASSTAAAKLGFPSSTVTGVVYAEPGGTAPRLITYSPSGQMDGIIVTTEES